MSDREKIIADFQKVMKLHDIVVDKYLSMCYNTCIDKLVREDDERERGKAQFIKELQRLTK